MLRRHVGQRRQRQAEAERRVARHQEGVAAAERPRLRDPDPVGIAVLAGGQARQRQDVARRLPEAARVDAPDPGVELHRAGLGVGRRDVDRQVGRLLLPEFAGPRRPGTRSRTGRGGGPARRPAPWPARSWRSRRPRAGLRGDQVRVAPDRLAVLAPVQREGPARQALARIPLALAVMQQAARARTGRAGAGSAVSARPRLVGPTAAMFHSGASKSSIDTKVGSPPMVRRTSWAARSASTRSPSASMAAQTASENGLVIRGASATRVTRISKPNVGLGRLGRARDRRGRAVVRRRGERDVALAAEQARRWRRGRSSRRPAGRPRPRRAGR